MARHGRLVHRIGKTLDTIKFELLAVDRRQDQCQPRKQKTRGLLQGKFTVTDCEWRHPLCDAFIEAAGDLGFPKNNDYNGASQAGAGYYQRKIYKGWRVSAATAFLRPATKRRNVEVRTRARGARSL